MFDAQDALRTIEQAERLHTQLHHQVLEQELSILKKELKHLPTCHGVMKDAQEISCEYYTNELKNTVLNLTSN